MKWSVGGIAMSMLLVATAWSQSAGRPTGDPTAPNGRPQGRTGGPVVTRHADFAIPYQVNDPAVTPEVQLMVSRDGGANWVGDLRQRADAGRFRFQAADDGEYWFAVRTFNTSGRPTDGGSFWQPELKVRVDTQVPAISLDVEVLSSGEVIAKWSIRDPSLDESKIYLSYQTAPQAPFQPVELSQENNRRSGDTITGEIRWWPIATERNMLVRMDAYDEGGNVAVSQKTVGLPLVAKRPAWNNFPRQPGGEPQDTHSAFQPTGPDRRDPFTQGRQGGTPQSIPWPENNQRGPLPVGGQFAGGTAPPTGNMPALPGVTPPAAHMAGNQGTWTPTGSSPGATRSGLQRPGGGDLAAQPQSAGASTAPGQQGPGRFEAASMKMEPPVANPQPQPRRSAVGLPPGVKPSMTNQKRFALNYSVDTVGPSGVGQVELWVTHDGGKSWEPGGVDPDRQSPFDVEVQQEGNYGFRIVVEGGNGLTGRRPQAGDLADIWVAVDTNQPVVTITSVVYGEGHRAGELDIAWTAHDANLAEAPISIYYSSSAAGPWEMVAEGLENTGLYTWRISPDVPADIYLKIVAEDGAGNGGEYILSRPIENDGLVPQAKIKSIESLPAKTDQAKLPVSIR
ncbi:MAG: hypothetical protein WDZ51_09300 [Pirellulaceae bacterium]